MSLSCSPALTLALSLGLTFHVLRRQPTASRSLLPSPRQELALLSPPEQGVTTGNRCSMGQGRGSSILLIHSAPTIHSWEGACRMPCTAQTLLPCTGPGTAHCPREIAGFLGVRCCLGAMHALRQRFALGSCWDRVCLAPDSHGCAWLCMPCPDSTGLARTRMAVHALPGPARMCMFKFAVPTIFVSFSPSAM